MHVRGAPWPPPPRRRQRTFPYAGMVARPPFSVGTGRGAGTGQQCSGPSDAADGWLPVASRVTGAAVLRSQLCAQRHPWAQPPGPPQGFPGPSARQAPGAGKTPRPPPPRVWRVRGRARPRGAKDARPGRRAAVLKPAARHSRASVSPGPQPRPRPVRSDMPSGTGSLDPARAVCCQFLLQMEMDAAEVLKCRGGPEDMGPDAGFPPLKVGDVGARAPSPVEMEGGAGAEGSAGCRAPERRVFRVMASPTVFSTTQPPQQVFLGPQCPPPAPAPAPVHVPTRLWAEDLSVVAALSGELSLGFTVVFLLVSSTNQS